MCVWPNLSSVRSSPPSVPYWPQFPCKKELRVLKNNLNGEYRLYSYAQKRLDQQFNELVMATQKSGGDIQQELDGALKQRTL